MENDIALIALVSLLGKAAFVGAFAWVFCRILRSEPEKIRVESRSRYALERARSTRHQR